MAKNQKRGAIELRWQRLGTVMLLVGGIAGLTVGYVMQRRAHDELGQQIKQVEREIEWLSDKVQREGERAERSRRKDVLMGRVAQMGLGLTDITSNQRVTIPLVEGGPIVTSVTGEKPASANSPASSVGPLATAAGVSFGTAR